MDKEFGFDFDLQLFGEAGGDGEAGSGDNAGDPQPDSKVATGQEENSKGQENEVGTGKANQSTLLGKTVEETEAYDFKSVVPEGMEYNQEQADSFAAIAKELKLSNEQASKLAAYGMNYAGSMTQLAQQARQNEIAGWGQEAKQELGIDFDRTLQKAGAGLEAMEKAIPNLREALNYTGAGNRIEFIRMLAFVGDLTKEDTFKGFGANSGATRSSLYGNTDFGIY